MSTVKVGNIIIGEGRPKICVPITASTISEIEKESLHIYSMKDTIDLVELRIDFFDNVTELDKVKEVITCVAQILKEVPILFTFRTHEEGGEREISIEAYKALLLAAVDSGRVQLIDIEIMKDVDIFSDIAEYAHKRDVLVVASNHDFEKTPTKDEILFRLMRMANEGGDIAKIAVMPQDENDVMTLLEATVMAKTCVEKPIVTISMGKLGTVTRIAGETFGSAITFGTAKKKSAPGQIDAYKLKDVLNILHDNQ